MKVTTLQENLARGLQIAGRAVSTRGSLPILGNVLLRTENGRLKLTATNLEVGLVLHFGKNARFYRVFFENRFKQRNQRCP